MKVAGFPPKAQGSSPVSGVLLLDKPPGYSSNQALGRVKRLLGLRSAGHTGTLDPFATGLLPIVVGEAAKFARFLIDADKGYQATLRLGYTSSTGDTEGEIAEKSPLSMPLNDVRSAIAEFKGVQMQRPPMHSAVRVQGRRLYDLAREGVEVDRPAREVHVKSIELDSISSEMLVMSVNCSKGTYIRVLAEDIGTRLGCGAYLTTLRRTAIGPFEIARAVTLAELEAGDPEAGRARLLPAEVLVSALPRVSLEPSAARALAHGQHPVARNAPGGECAMFASDGRFLGVALARGGAWVPVRLMGPAATHAPDFT